MSINLSKSPVLYCVYYLCVSGDAWAFFLFWIFFCLFDDSRVSRSLTSLYFYPRGFVNFLTL